jgi:hypothetical protein
MVSTKIHSTQSVPVTVGSSSTSRLETQLPAQKSECSQITKPDDGTTALGRKAADGIGRLVPRTSTTQYVKRCDLFKLLKNSFAVNAIATGWIKDSMATPLLTVNKQSPIIFSSTSAPESLSLKKHQVYVIH